VADLSTVLAGPYCTMLLGDLGADVVKVEPLDGDATRGYGPPDAGGESAYYLSVNRNKLGMRLDLRTEGGREVAGRLIERSDILVENFRAGAFARLGFDDARLEGLNRRLIHLAITGYGPDGPAAARPGYDFVIQAEAGLMSITGMPDAEGGEPTKVGLAIADLCCGMLGATAVLAALHARDLPTGPTHGRGQRIDISVFESTVSWLANQAANYLVGGIVPGRMGNSHPNITPYETFPTANGQIAVAVGSERQWSRFCAALGLEDFRDDPRFATNAARVRHRGELRPLVAERFVTRARDEWLAALGKAEVPCGPINDLAAVFADPQVEARRMIETVDHPTIGPLRLTGIPFKLTATPARVRTSPPLLGQHTDELLGWLGYDEAAIERLRRERAI
jgi:formyl-CoA transferase